MRRIQLVSWAAQLALPLLLLSAPLAGITKGEFSDVVTRSPWADIRSFGAVANDGLDDTAAIQAALDTPVSATVIVPAGNWRFTTLTQTRDDVELVLMAGATLEATTAAHGVSAITWRGANGTIRGPGRILSPAAWDGANDRDVYATVRVTGSGFSAHELVLENIPRAGILFQDVNEGKVVGCTFHGNYPAGSYTGIETGHMGIWIDPVDTGPQGSFVIQGNLIQGCVQGIFVGNLGHGVGHGILIAGNVFSGNHNHGIYCANGKGIAVTGNSFFRCSDPIVVSGESHSIVGNTIYTNGTNTNLDRVSISIRDAVRCVCEGNTIYGEQGNGQAVIIISNVSTTEITDNIIAHNIVKITKGTATAIKVGDGARTRVLARNIIQGNIVDAGGLANQGVISILTATGHTGEANKIIDNIITVSNENFGLFVHNQRHASISGNTIIHEYNAPGPVTTAQIFMSNVSDSTIFRNQLICNLEFGENVTLRAIQETNGTAINRITDNIVNHESTRLIKSIPFFNIDGTRSTLTNNTDCNPVGVTPVVPTGSPFAYTATGGATILYIRGGTATKIHRGPLVVADTSPATIFLNPGETCTMTYSSAPTIIADVK